MEKQEAFLCPFCGAPYRELIPAGTVQVKCRYCGATVLVPPRLGGQIKRCPNHPETLAVGICNRCGESYCDRCLHVISGKEYSSYYCPKCIEKFRYEFTKIQYLFGALLFFGIFLLLLGGDPAAFLLVLFSTIIGVLVLELRKTSRYPTIYEKKMPKVELAEKPEYLYEKLLHVYTMIYGGGRQFLEHKIESLNKQGLNREEAIRKLAEKEKLIKGE